MTRMRWFPVLALQMLVKRRMATLAWLGLLGLLPPLPQAMAQPAPGAEPYPARPHHHGGGIPPRGCR